MDVPVRPFSDHQQGTNMKIDYDDSVPVVPPGAPRWVTADLLADTMRFGDNTTKT